MPSRFDLLTPTEPPRKLVHYTFGLSQMDNDLHVLRQEAAPQVTLRPTRAMTNVERRGQVELEALYIDIGTDEAPRHENQLAVGRLDAYAWCYEHVKEVQLAFMREHGLFSHEQMYDYCDEHDIEVPDPTRVHLPTLRKGKTVRLTGRILNLPPGFMFILQIIGAAEPCDGSD